MRLVVLFLLVLAAPAQAATVRVSRYVDSDPREDVEATTVIYRAAPKERNRLSVIPRGRTVTIADPGARIRAGRRCRSLGPHRARCRLDRYLDPFFDADLGARSDRFRERVAGLFTYDVRGGGGPDRLVGGPGRDRFSGEDGDDRLTGGGGDDELRDGPGLDAVGGGAGADLLLSTDRDDAVSDRFDGGAGRDTLSYERRRDRVVGRIDRTSGVGGERDRMTAVEGLVGGAGSDVLYGSVGPDLLAGGDGSDRLHGGAGHDVLNPGGGTRDRLYAGQGDDRLTVPGGPFATVDEHCGPGDDVSVTGSGDHLLLRPDCERIVSLVFPGRSYPAQPGRVTPRRVTMTLPCAYKDKASLRRVRLVAAGRTLAEGRRGVGPGPCRVRLRRTVAIGRPTRVRLRYLGDPAWSFLLVPL